MPFHSALVDPTTGLALTVSDSAFERQQHGHLSPEILAPLYHSAPCPAIFFPSEPSQTRSPSTSPRRLPIPPKHVSHSPSASTSSSSSSSLSISTQLSPGRPHFSRPLPKRPEYPPGHLENQKRHSGIDERSSPATSPASPSVPQRPTDFEEIRQGNLSKLRRHLGTSVPSDLVPPRFDGDEASDGSSGDRGDLPTTPITAECLLELTDPKRGDDYSCGWLREKKGRRWVEESYDAVIQSLREL